MYTCCNNTTHTGSNHPLQNLQISWIYKSVSTYTHAWISSLQAILYCTLSIFTQTAGIFTHSSAYCVLICSAAWCGEVTCTDEQCKVLSHQRYCIGAWTTTNEQGLTLCSLSVFSMSFNWSTLSWGDPLVVIGVCSVDTDNCSNRRRSNSSSALLEEL